MTELNSTTRNFELDWLRVATVLLVFFHHIGMPFVGSDWHVVNKQSSKLLDDIMVFFEQWRLPLLLLISGAGTVMAFSKRSPWQFIKERSYRLLIPLIFGALVIIPPQTYFEFIGNYDSYVDVYPDAIIHPETNHLWFIKFLFVFSLIAIPLVVFLRSEKSAKAKERIEKALGNKWGLLWLVVPLIVLRVVTRIYFPDDEGGITNLAKSLFYFYFFIAGIILFSCRGLWRNLLENRNVHLVAAAISFVLFYFYYYVPQEWLPESMSVAVRWSLWWVVGCLVAWNTILVILGYAQVYLNKPHAWLPRLNEAIYPFYILHQTVIVALAYFIVQWEMPIILKLCLLAVSSFVGIVLVYGVVVYPFRFTRMLFGMKTKRANRPETVESTAARMSF